MGAVLDYWEREKEKADKLKKAKNEELKQKLEKEKQKSEILKKEQKEKMMSTKIRLRKDIDKN